MGELVTTYREWRSTLVDATVWTRTADGSAGWVLPDGCLDVLWDGEQLTVAGPDTGPQLTDAARGTSYVALRFDPGVGPAVLGHPADPLRNLRVPLGDVVPPDEAGRLADGVRSAGEGAERLLERWAAERIAAGAGPDDGLRQVAALLDRGMRVAEVADAVGLGERQLHRRSLAAFGYGPKVLARILRLQRALALARGGTAFARTAAEAGYADQAHLAREVRALAGRPLGQLVDGSAANRSTPVPSGSRRLA